MASTLISFLAFTLATVPSVLAHGATDPMGMGAAAASSGHSHGDSTAATAHAGGMMIPYFHFQTGDNLWFLGWVPTSVGAMVGTCLGLFFLAILERWIGACRAIIEAHWKTRAEQALLSRRNTASTEKMSPFKRALSVPFIATHDIPRGLIHLAQTALSFLFMLAAMTYQVAFIIAIVVGLGVGETLFGRYATGAAHLH